MTQDNGKRPPDPRQEEPGVERRASHRVTDEQNSGQGALSALSKLKMQERKRAEVPLPRDESTPIPLPDDPTPGDPNDP